MDVREFSKGKVGELKKFKSEKLESSKTTVETIHSRLKSDRQITSELVHLDDIASHLPRRLQPLFSEMPYHKDVLRDVNKLNTAFLPVLDYLVVYKSEMGLIL